MAATNVFLQASNQGSTSKLSQNHSTIMNVPNSFRQISFDSWNKHQVTIADEHSWLESFMENVLIASTSKGKGTGMAELMKTPAKNRIALGSNNNFSTSKNKDSLATILFPTSIKSSELNKLSPKKFQNKENLISPRSVNKNKLWSPEGVRAGNSGLRAAIGSPGTRSREGSPEKRSAVKAGKMAERFIEEDPVVEEEVEIDDVVMEDEDVAQVDEPGLESTSSTAINLENQKIHSPPPPASMKVLIPVESGAADLSMIGEEEEEEEMEEVVENLVEEFKKLASPIKESRVNIIEKEPILVVDTVMENILLPVAIDSPRSSTTSVSQVFVDALEVESVIEPVVELVEPAVVEVAAPLPAYTMPLKDEPKRNSQSTTLSRYNIPPFNANRPAVQPTSSSPPPPPPQPTTLYKSTRLSDLPLPLSSAFSASIRAGGNPLTGKSNHFHGLNSGTTLRDSDPLNPLKRKSLTGGQEEVKIAKLNDLEEKSVVGGLNTGKTRMDSIKSRLQSMTGGARLPPSPPTASTSTAAITRSFNPVSSPKTIVTLPTLTRKNSVTDLVRNFEKTSSTVEDGGHIFNSPNRMLNTNKVYGSPIISPKSVKRVGISSSLARPISPAPIMNHRMNLRSPSRFGLESSHPILRNQIEKVIEEVEVVVSTTPKGSPVKPITRPILKEMKVVEKIPVKKMVVEPIIEIVEMEELSSEVEDIVGEEIEKEVILPSLPDRLSMSYDKTLDDIVITKGQEGMTTLMPHNPIVKTLVQEEEEEEEMVVEAVKLRVVKAKSTKVILPAREEEEEGDITIESIRPFFTKKLEPIVKEKTSSHSLASSIGSDFSSMGSSGPFKPSLKRPTLIPGGKTEVKSIQLAAAAAKKEAQVKEKKAGMKEEREQRRAITLQKKADEDRLKIEGEKNLERRIREDASAALVAASTKSKLVRQKSKLDSVVEPEVALKKRKVEPPPPQEPKALLKKPISRPPSNSYASGSGSTSTMNRVPLTAAALKQNGKTSMIGSKFMSDQVKLVGGNGKAPSNVNPFAPKASTSTGIARPILKPVAVVEEDIILPDIASEYSDSGDEDHAAKIQARPGWAQSPQLAESLYRQQLINPDDIFGAIPTLEMGEIFKTRSTRISKRTSSAIWEGTDALTESEQLRYNRQMGFISLPGSNLRH